MDNFNKEVEEMLQPKMEVSKLIRTIFQETISCGANDYFLLMFNTDNVSDSHSLRFFINNILHLRKTTNVIIRAELNKNLDSIITNRFRNRIKRYKAMNSNFFYGILSG